MEFDLDQPGIKYVYKLLSGLVTPRPIAWVTTLNEDGSVNAAPFSFFNLLGTDPPILAFSPGNRSLGVPKDTARNIRLTGEFVVNMVDESHAQAMNLTASDFAAGISEVEAAQLSTTPSVKITVPRITESPVALECREWSTLEIGRNRVVVGTIHHVHVRDGLVDPETYLVDPLLYAPIGRMEAPGGYCHTRDRFEMPRH